MADAVGNDHEPAIRIQRLAAAEQFSGKPVGQKAQAPAPRAVQQQHRVGNATVRASFRSAKREVVQFHFGKRFAACEAEVAQDEIAVDRLGIRRRLRRYCKKQKERKE